MEIGASKARLLGELSGVGEGVSLMKLVSQAILRIVHPGKLISRAVGARKKSNKKRHGQGGDLKIYSRETHGLALEPASESMTQFRARFGCQRPESTCTVSPSKFPLCSQSLPAPAEVAPANSLHPSNRPTLRS